MRMRTAAIGGLILALATAGCGSAAEEPVATVEDPLAAVQAASQSTGELTSYRMAMSFDVEQTGDPCTDAFGTLMPDTEMAVTTAGDEVRIEATDSKTGATGRHVDGVSYIEATGLPTWSAPTPWVSLDESDWEAYTGLDLSTFGLLDVGTDDMDDITALQFEEMLDSLELDGLTVTEVGPDEVRGEPATHYQVDIETEVSAEMGFLSADVWVGSDGYVRRMTTTTPSVDFTEGLGLPALTMTLEIWDVGAEISIEAPPADEVTPLSEVEAPTDPGSLMPTDLLEACMPALDGLDLDDGVTADLESMLPSDEAIACVEDVTEGSSETTFPVEECFEL